MSEAAVRADDFEGEPAFLHEPGSGVRVGMACFLVSEAFFFGTLIVAYLCYMGRDTEGPTPAQCLDLPLPLVGTACLLVSSLTVALAEKGLHAGRLRDFRAWMTLTIVLGLLFLAGTAVEWRNLIVRDGLTIERNLFGSTYFTLVGFHGFHVSLGVIALTVTRRLATASPPRVKPIAVEMVSWYWHFVDAVWIVVFIVVYGVSRGVFG